MQQQSGMVLGLSCPTIRGPRSVSGIPIRDEDLGSIGGGGLDSSQREGARNEDVIE